MEVDIIKYLADEIKKEQEYERLYNEACKSADYMARVHGGYSWDYFDSKKFPRTPSKMLIKDYAKMIRRLAKKLYEG